MATVSVSRELDAPPDAVEAAIRDVEDFMRAGGFDEVAVEDETVRIAQHLGLARLALTLDVVDDPDTALSLVQREGLFEAMDTHYVVEPAGDGSTVTATTDFTIGGVVGSVLDATIVKRRRTAELTAQFDYLEREVG